MSTYRFVPLYGYFKCFLMSYVWCSDKKVHEGCSFEPKMKKKKTDSCGDVTKKELFLEDYLMVSGKNNWGQLKLNEGGHSVNSHICTASLLRVSYIQGRLLMLYQG